MVLLRAKDNILLRKGKVKKILAVADIAGISLHLVFISFNTILWRFFKLFRK
jgi:hypothetical protein